MCDFGCGDYKREELIDGLDQVLDRLAGAPLIHLAIPGSILDDDEVPADFRHQVLAAVAARGAVAIGVEARPEHMRVENLVSAARVAQEASGSRLVEFSVGTGVEAFDDAVTRVCVNKVSTRAAALRALAAIKSADSQLHDVKLVAEAHVLLKPPVLTEVEAIEDAAAAIEWCLAEGFERVILMLCSAKPHSPLGMLARTGEPSMPGASYRPASLWSAIEVLSRLPDSMRPGVRVHGFASNTEVGLTPTTCPACEQVVIAAIQHFNATGVDDGLEAVRRLGCECRGQWRSACEQEPQDSLMARMTGFVDALERASEAEEPLG